MAKVIDCDVLLVETEERMTAQALIQKISSLDAQQRDRLFAVVGTGGTTNAGIIDDLSGIAAVCHKENLWFHVDAAYGGGALASKTARPFLMGLKKRIVSPLIPINGFFHPTTVVP